MAFSKLRLSPPILRALEQEGYTTPTPIQQQAIPHALEGRDVLGCAQTGTGKTAAFALPILQRLSGATVDKTHRGPRKARALILAPTRELAVQIAESFGTYGRGSSLTHTVIYGGVSQFHQERALRQGVDIIVATPGRLLDLMEQRIVDLSGVQVLVLDEADRMLDMGFIDPIRRIAAATPPPPARQTLLFSATMPGPIQRLADSLLREPVKVTVTPVSSAAPAIEQGVYLVDRSRKQSLLEHVLSDAAATRALVFTRTKHGADKVGRKLAQAGIHAETIHGNKSQPQRRRALANFSSGKAQVLVATDVAARGLDVDDVTHVVNYDLPVEPEAYVHRIGRTGRAGATGVALSFCDGEERTLLRDIERLIGKKIEVRDTSGMTLVAAVREPHQAHRAHQPRSAPRSGAGKPSNGKPRRAHGPSKAASAPAARSHGHGGQNGQAGHAGHGGHGGHGGQRGHGAARSASGGWRKPTRRSSVR